MTNTAAITTEAGNICHVDIAALAAEMLAGVNDGQGMKPSPELIAAKLAGQTFRGMSDLDAAINELVENDASVFVPVSGWNVYDSDTGELIGPATDEQIDASMAVYPEGHILIDADGAVVEPGTWQAEQGGVRKVFAA